MMPELLEGGSIINSLPAVWAVGAIGGGLMGAGAIALNIARDRDPRGGVG